MRPLPFLPRCPLDRSASPPILPLLLRRESSADDVPWRLNHALDQLTWLASLAHLAARPFRPPRPRPEPSRAAFVPWSRLLLLLTWVESNKWSPSFYTRTLLKMKRKASGEKKEAPPYEIPSPYSSFVPTATIGRWRARTVPRDAAGERTRTGSHRWPPLHYIWWKGTLASLETNMVRKCWPRKCSNLLLLNTCVFMCACSSALSRHATLRPRLSPFSCRIMKGSPPSYPNEGKKETNVSQKGKECVRRIHSSFLNRVIKTFLTCSKDV